MDAGYTRYQAYSWHLMSEAAQHAWLRREQYRHVDTCQLCQSHGFTPKKGPNNGGK